MNMDGKITSEVKQMGRDVENLKKWVKTNIYRYNFELNRVNDKELIEKLESVPNKKQYLISLIKQDIQKEKSTNQ